MLRDHGRAALAGCRRIRSSLHGRSASGKTHVAQALVHRGPPRRRRALRQTSRMLSDLAGGHAGRSGASCIRELHPTNSLLILDDFAMREHTAMHADDLYELISDRATPGKPRS